MKEGEEATVGFRWFGGKLEGCGGFEGFEDRVGFFVYVHGGWFDFIGRAYADGVVGLVRLEVWVSERAYCWEMTMPERDEYRDLSTEAPDGETVRRFG
jgi:hypothetical protein